MLGSDALLGQTVSHYRILEKLGDGGMGVVYKAEDTRLHRNVALKFLPDNVAKDTQALARFQREAQTASALNHPNICTIYEIDEVDGKAFIAMEYLEGTTLKQLIQEKGLKTDQILNFGVEIADALAASHAKGIIHRDIKPANIFITTHGHVKILDFGLAKLSTKINEPAGTNAVTLDLDPQLTKVGIAVGTVAYMSPEQILGEEIDARSDLYSFGVVLYEMCAEKLPFRGESFVALSHSILRTAPPVPSSVNPQIPSDLDRIICKALDKVPNKRFTSASEMRVRLGGLRQQRPIESSASLPMAHAVRRPSFLVPAFLLLAIAAAASGLFYRHYARIRWVHEVALPQLQQLALEGKGVDFYRLIEQAQRYSPHDPAVEQTETKYAWPSPILSTPQGADVFFREYGDPQAAWVHLGKTPLKDLKLLWTQYSLKFVKDGFETLEVTTEYIPDAGQKSIILDPVGTLPKGMVHIPPGEVRVPGNSPVALDEFFIDKYEVTNREFKKFIDAGGYRDPKYWRYPFVKEGSTLSFDEAMALFVDKTDRPAPSA